MWQMPDDIKCSCWVAAHIHLSIQGHYSVPNLDNGVPNLDNDVDNDCHNEQRNQ